MRFVGLLVAEKSVIFIIKNIVRSLIENSDVSEVFLVVPDDQINLFREELVGISAELVSENEIISVHQQEIIKYKLGKKAHRYGWYLQQFLKLNFIYYLDREIEEYLIWDADTLLLEKKEFFGKGKEFLVSNEYHSSYFETIKNVVNVDRQVDKSFISQYMIINRFEVSEFFNVIGAENPSLWYLKVLDCLPLIDDSEFSEYETYGNFVVSKYGEDVTLKEERWFRYGSAVIDINKVRSMSYDEISNLFRGYVFVAFERHNYSFIKKTIAKLMCYLGL